MMNIGTDHRRAGVLGGGSWGTALAEVLARAGYDVTLVMRSASDADFLNREHRNPRYVSAHCLSLAVKAVTDVSHLKDCKLIVLAVPCQHMRESLRAVRGSLSGGAVLINAAKGIEINGLALPHTVAEQELPTFVSSYAVLSGPSFADEVLSGKPTAVVLGCADAVLAVRLRDVFSVDRFRAYSCGDVVGVELGGAVKNVIAIAAGIADGLGFGQNARAALVTRGIAEISRLGLALGASPETFMGLSGLGDLTLTCTGDLSRNRRVGLKLAEGKTLDCVIEELGMVAEGVKTTDAVHRLARSKGVEMPVTEAVFDILYGGLNPFEAVKRLFSRSTKEEAVR